MIGYKQPVTRGHTDVAPHFLQTCSEVGEERDEFSPIRSRNKPPKGSTSEFFKIYLFIFFYIYVYIYVQLFTYVQISSIPWATGVSAEQPLQVPGGRALNQLRPHPSGKIV